MRALTIVAIALIAAPTVASATDYQVNANMNYRDVLENLVAGDTVMFAAGQYRSGFPINGLNGTASRPIVITGPSTTPRAVIHGRSCCNTISIRDSSYVTIRSFDVDGGGEYVDAVKAESDATSAHHITIEDLHITGHDAGQQAVGISTKCPAWDWSIRYNVIEQTGTGIYLGQSDGSAPFVRGIIEYNVITDPIGYCMEIKHQIGRPSLAGMPTGDSTTLIRHNVFSKSANASTGGSARPNLLVGHWPTSGRGSNDRYEIYGNLLYQNQSGSEPLFQGEGNVALHDNIMINTFGSALDIVPHNDVPREVSIYHNTIYASGDGIFVSGVQGGFTARVVANAVFAASPIANPGGDTRDNVTDSRGNAGTYLNNPGTNLAGADFYPRSGQLQGSAADLSAFATHIDNSVDFNGNIRPGTYRGAYAGSGNNPGWRLAIDTKPGGTRGGGTTPTPDAGVTPDAGATPIADAGSRLDAGAPIDSGSMPGIDAGLAGPDANTPGPDARTTSSDATATSDARPGDENNRRATRSRSTGGGCSCDVGRSTRSSALFMFALLPLVWRRRGRLAER